MSLPIAVNTWYQRSLGQRNLVGQILRKMRRFYLGTFKPEYVQKAIAETRKGECHRCGLCCELIYKCPFLGRDNQNLPYCRVYGDLRPANCRNYPFDIKDAEIDTCGYSFVSKPTQSNAKKSTSKAISASAREGLPLSSSAAFQGKN